MLKISKNSSIALLEFICECKFYEFRKQLSFFLIRLDYSQTSVDAACSTKRNLKYHSLYILLNSKSSRARKIKGSASKTNRDNSKLPYMCGLLWLCFYHLPKSCECEHWENQSSSCTKFSDLIDLFNDTVRINNVQQISKSLWWRVLCMQNCTMCASILRYHATLLPL